MKLFEISMKGPGDYFPGDEHNPRSPDYDPDASRKAELRRSQFKSKSNDQEYVRPEDQEWDRRMKAAQKQREQYQQAKKLASGEYNGKPYNIIYKFKGPKGYGLKNQVDKFLDFERNIYHDFAGVEYKDLDEETGVAIIYIQAKPQSFIMQALQREQQQ